MKITIRALGLLVMAVSLAVLGRPAEAADAKAAVLAANKVFEAAVARGDAAGMAACYTATAELLPAHNDAVAGRPAIEKFWRGVLDAGIKQAKLTSIEVEIHATDAHEVGEYELQDDKGRVLDKGKYVVIWKRDGGGWKLHRDIWTTSLPPGPM
jgi:ketosteroid isomerase-like protein